MTVRDIAYVELLTSDEQDTVGYFQASMGFSQVARSTEPERSSVFLRQGDVRLVVSSGPATWKFLDAHGDGVADIALRCDDVVRTREAAAAAGARIVTPGTRSPTVVSGFGDVCHTLLPVAENAGPALPDDRPWIPEPTPGTRQSRPDPIRLLDHVAVCLEGGTLEAYADLYRDAFGFSRYSSEYVDVGGQAMDSIVVRSASGRVTFTLVAPDPRLGSGQLDAYLERNAGPGVQHLAFLVDDIVPTVHAFRGRGVEFLNTPASYYDMLLERHDGLHSEIDSLRAAHVLADRDEWGYLLQLFSRSPYERNTLFYELIQRRGSRGFGSSNIRALYEAVERDRLNAE
ncbi:MAG: 4-hydroxyphenylpyruvate dioxygenase [Streptomyces sp.]|uniref:4-hydroxyphenylpyruvate dioxygenase n=1 Tax=Streptomyces sp. TaxID=1931 RepID=UPI0025FE6872|nr:4-hydroxyphenylpyruvate dioxygenase [Streptomyces sp.]MBW8793908.1 4-hydroxyphenylpyruvate dioxygenase [Streptomyces sp.]